MKYMFIFALSISILIGAIGKPYVDVDKKCEFSHSEIDTHGIVNWPSD